MLKSIHNFKVDLKCHWNDTLRDFQLVHHFWWTENLVYLKWWTEQIGVKRYRIIEIFKSNSNPGPIHRVEILSLLDCHDKSC